ncbi:hypothetical protein Trydic_g14639 [Trypoxylus dichotomus]
MVSQSALLTRTVSARLDYLLRSGPTRSTPISLRSPRRTPSPRRRPVQLQTGPLDHATTVPDNIPHQNDLQQETDMFLDVEKAFDKIRHEDRYSR